MQGRKLERPLQQASTAALAALSRGLAGTCRVPMHETDYPLLLLLRQHDESIRPRLSARPVPRARSQSINPTRHLRSRRIAVREASPNARPSPAPYDRPFHADPGSLPGRLAAKRSRHALTLCVPESPLRRKNKAFSIEVAAHGFDPSHEGHLCPHRERRTYRFSLWGTNYRR